MLTELVFIGLAAYLIVHDFGTTDWQARFDDIFETLGLTNKRRRVPVRVVIENTDIRRKKRND